MTIRLICIDADDTLWHNEPYFRSAAKQVTELLAQFSDEASLAATLTGIEHRNLAIYGYGVKGFVLSLVETAVEVAGKGLKAGTVGEILGMGRAMMRHPVDLLDGVEDGLSALQQRGQLVLVTKGDLFHQEAKLAASGLETLFSGVEVVSSKTSANYRRIFERHGAPAAEAVMVGNSMRSDVLPALEAGAYAALVPYPLLWEHEAADPPQDRSRFRSLASLGELADWIDQVAAVPRSQC